MDWTTPTALHHVTSHFNLLRRHPVTGIFQPHWGTDYRAYLGTTLRAAADGRVVTSTDDGGVAGRYVRIDHGDGIWTGYSHLHRRNVSVGDRVKVGQTIGLAGMSGSATAAHLHFEVSVNGTKRDPHKWLASKISTTSNPGGGGGSLPNPTPSNPPDPLEEINMWGFINKEHDKRDTYSILRSAEGAATWVRNLFQRGQDIKGTILGGLSKQDSMTGEGMLRMSASSYYEVRLLRAELASVQATQSILIATIDRVQSGEPLDIDKMLAGVRAATKAGVNDAIGSNLEFDVTVEPRGNA